MASTQADNEEGCHAGRGRQHGEGGGTVVAGGGACEALENWEGVSRKQPKCRPFRVIGKMGRWQKSL
jgi:hypothetical protein